MILFILNMNLIYETSPFERILSLNKYREALGHDELKMKTIKMPSELT